MQPGGGDYSSPYFPNPYPHHPYTSSFPNSVDFSSSSAASPIPSTYASAPPYSPYTTDFAAAAATTTTSPSVASYSPYNPASDLPPSAPSYSHPQPPTPYYSPEPHPPPPPPLPQYFPYEAPPPPPPPPPGAVPNPNPLPYPSYDSGYDGAAARFDQKSGYFGENLSNYAPPSVSGGGGGGGGGYGRSFSSSSNEQDFYSRKLGSSYPYDGLDEGAYAYDGGRGAEPYGARGTAPTRSGPALFDDYGRSISLPNPSGGAKERGGGGVPAAAKIVRAVPKEDVSEDVKNCVQKFRVKLLPEGAGSPMDVLCQVGLDGIRMLDPNTSRTLRIYPLENVTRWEVLDSAIFAFWSKSSVDIEPRRIRLKSNSYTTSTILDTVTAATVQFKEIGGSSIARSKAVADAAKSSEQQNEKKKGFIDWRNFIKPVNEEKDHWVPDEAVNKCTACGADFNAFNRRHHCRNCGDIFCDKCTQGRIALTADVDAQPVRVCDRCMAEVSQRLNNAKEATNRPVVHSHEDLAKKLQEAMDINRKSSSASRSSDGSGRRMREVACPICTVHLQVQVPTSGSETIECGVCQHPFLVSAH